MKIMGLNKTTLLDYPEHIAATVFTGGCNFRCPFCHNKDLVLSWEKQEDIGEKETLVFLKKRNRVLGGVCISGGEPAIQTDLKSFIQRIKEIGYPVKLDTNGSFPEVIGELLQEELLDYIAMDIKNAPEKYSVTAGVNDINLKDIRTSISLIKSSQIPYEFRTTVVRELHTKEDMKKIGEELQGAEAYYLQAYKESDGVISPGFHAFSKSEMEEMAETLRPYVSSVFLRGID